MIDAWFAISIRMLQLTLSLDPEVLNIMLLSLKVSGTAVLMGALIGVPIGVFLGLRFGGKLGLMRFINTLEIGRAHV